VTKPGTLQPPWPHLITDDGLERKREHSEEGPLVGTLPQELSSLQLAGEPIMVQRKTKPSGARRKCQRKQEKANAAPQADGGPGARGAHSGESCTGTDVDTGGSSCTKRPLSPGGTRQDAQSQVKRTKQKQKDHITVRDLLRFLTSSRRFS